MTSYKHVLYAPNIELHFYTWLHRNKLIVLLTFCCGVKNHKFDLAQCNMYVFDLSYLFMCKFVSALVLFTCLHERVGVFLCVFYMYMYACAQVYMNICAYVQNVCQWNDLCMCMCICICILLDVCAQMCLHSCVNVSLHVNEMIFVCEFVFMHATIARLLYHPMLCCHSLLWH